MPEGVAMEPKCRYILDGSSTSEGISVQGPARVLSLHGRKGIHPGSIHTVIKLSAGHTINQPRGTMVLWFFPLEDLAASFLAGHMKIDNEFFASYPFISDCATPRNIPDANFSLEWNRFNEFRAKFFKGTIYPSLHGFAPPQKAWVQAVPFNYFRKHRWYQIAVTWDDAAKSASLFVNGVHLGKSDTFNKDFFRDQCGDTLFMGCPALCSGQVEFYDRLLSSADLYKCFRDYTPDYDPAIEHELRHAFEGTELENFNFTPGEGWTKQLDIDFQKPAEQIKQFYIQGEVDAVKPLGQSEGLLIETPNIPYGTPQAFPRQVYIWSEKTFEGNIYVEFEWKALEPNGLSLLMVHASGMTREDFMNDWPRKTSGIMQTVHEENVRNYHWEFYREMNDVRNDVGTAFSRKNPFAYRIGFGSSPVPFATNQWHKAQLVQQEGKLLGAIDGKILLEINDSSRNNSGCILNYGHIALRCMVHTKMVFRNLKVYTDKLPFTEEATLS